MTGVFVDTSALVSLLFAGERSHATASRAFKRLAKDGATLFTSSFVLVETYALLDRRVERDAVFRFRSDFAPLLQVVWIDQELHEAGLDRLAARRGEELSLVDACSLAVMERLGLERAFAFDRRFARAGFELVN